MNCGCNVKRAALDKMFSSLDIEQERGGDTVGTPHIPSLEPRFPHEHEERKKCFYRNRKTCPDLLSEVIQTQLIKSSLIL